jgi:hypothetical protein
MKKVILFCKSSCRNLLTLLLPLMFITMGTINVKAQTITPGENPSEVVPMGDSLAFSVTIYSATAISNAQLEIVVPAGFELLPTTPGFIAGSLSPDKLTGRIMVNLIAGTVPNIKIYVKPLCDAATATPLANRKISYQLYQPGGTTPIGSPKLIDNPIQNFYNPILLVNYPAAQEVSTGQVYTRTFTLVQTLDHSHIRNIKASLVADTSGFYITQIRVRRNASKSWINIPLVSKATGYEYVIPHDLIFTPANGYPNGHLHYQDSLIVEETVTLKKCGAGTVNYEWFLGDGTTFCTPALTDGSVTWQETQVAYTPDITTAARLVPNGPTQNGFLTFEIRNNGTISDLVLYDMYVNVVTGYKYLKAYFSTNTGAVIVGPGGATDTVFLQLNGAGTNNTSVRFESCNNPALAAYYTARNLSNKDGDGVYNDLEIGKSVFITVQLQYDLTNTNCSAQLNAGGTRRADLYYRTFCKQSWIGFTRPYGNDNLTTNCWNGHFFYQPLENPIVTPNVNLFAGDQTTIKIAPVAAGNCSNQMICAGWGSLDGNAKLADLACAQVEAEAWTVITLPPGLSFVPQGSLNPGINSLRVNTSVVPPADITVIPGAGGGGDVIRIKWSAAIRAGLTNGYWYVPVANTGPIDNTKLVEIYFEYDYGKTGVVKKWGCQTKAVPYNQMLPCSNLEMRKFDANRVSLGWKSAAAYQTPSGRADLAYAQANNYNLKFHWQRDNIDLEGKILSNSALSLNNREIWVEVEYNATVEYYQKIPATELPNTIEVFYNNLAAPITIPFASVTMANTGTGTSAKRFIRANIAPFIMSQFPALGTSGLQANDSLRIVIHTRLYNAPAKETTVGIQMKVYDRLTAAPNTVTECSPLMDQATIWNSQRSNLTTASGGVNNTPICAWEFRSTQYMGIMTKGVPWSQGATATLLTGGEYRPNDDNFSKVVIEFPMLLKVNSINRAHSGFIAGSWTNKNPIDTITDFTVTYSDGKTFITLENPPADLMTMASSSGFGYNMNASLINGNFRNTGAAVSWPYQISYARDEYPTSGLPSRDTLNRLTASDACNGGTFVYPWAYALSVMPSNATPLSSRVEWTLRITNQSRWAGTSGTSPYSWVALEVPKGVVPIEIRDAVTNLPIPGATWEQYYSDATKDYYWVKLGTITTSTSTYYKDYIIDCSYTVCTGKPSITAKFGNSQVDYPQDPRNGYAQAPYNSPGYLYGGSTASNATNGIPQTSMTFTPPVIDFAAYLEHIPNITGGKNAFCDTMTFIGSFTNGLSTYINDLELKMPMPSGFQFYGSYVPQVKFGNGAWTNAQSASMSAGSLVIQLDNSKELLSYGAANNADKAWVRFKLRMVCGVDNGIQPEAEFIGHSGCGASKSKIQVTAAPIRIGGLTPPPVYDITNLLLTQTPFTGGAGGDGTMILSGLYTLTEMPSDSVKAIIDLPANLLLDSTMMPSIQFHQQGRRLTASLPAIANIGDTYPFKIKLRPTNPQNWSMDSVFIYIRLGKVNLLTCDGITCPILEFSDRYDSVTVSMQKIEVCFNDSIRAVGSYNDNNTERVVVDGWLVNSGNLDAGRLTMEWCYFDGVDYVPVNDVISTLTVYNVLQEDSVAFHIYANIRYTENICDMWLLLRKNYTLNGALNPYLADDCLIKIPVPRYEISEVVDPVCQMTGATTIGEQPIKDYKYTWHPNTYLTISNRARVDFGYDWEGNPYYGDTDTTLIYLVDIQRPNGCISTDTVFVPLKPLPYVSQPKDTVLCDGESFRVEFDDPHNLSTTYSWTVDGGLTAGFAPYGTSHFIHVNAVHNMGSQPVIVTIRVTPKRNGCEGESKIFFITINPKPRTYMIPDQINCAGSTVPATTIVGNLADALYKWELKSGDNTAGTDGVVIIPTYIAQNNTLYNRVGEYRAWGEYEYGGKLCYSDSINFSITIEPMPTVLTTGSTELCSGSALTLSFTGTPAGNTYQYQKMSGSNIPGLASMGEGNISIPSIVNTSHNTLTSVYRITPVSASGRCMGAQDNLTINVYPIPTLSSSTAATLCSGETFDYTLTSPVSGVSFTWTRAASANINGGAGRTGSGHEITETLISTATTPVAVTYVVTLAANGCSNTANVTVTINPKPALTTTLTPAAICSGANFSYTATSGVTGTIISWERLDNASILQPGTSGTGNVPATMLTNTSTSPTTVHFIYSLSTPTGCTNEQDVRVVVNPRPVLSSTLTPAALCSGNTFNYTARSSTSGVTFSWARVANAGITGTPMTGTGASISQVLTNTTANPITVKYAVTMTVAGGGCNGVDTVEVVVNPIPAISSAMTIPAICSGSYAVYHITSATQNSSFTWRRIANSNISQAVTNGVTPLISEQLTINDGISADQTVTYNIISSANGCTNGGENITVIVHPLPTLNVLPATVNMATGDVITLTASSNAPASGITWVSGNTGIATVAPASGTYSTTLTALSAGATYITATMTNANGCIRSQQVLVNVGPTNVAALSLASGYPSEICNGGSTRLNISISGGEVPYRVKYKWRTGAGAWSSAMLINLSSSTNITVSPANTTTGIINVEYAIDSAWTSTNQLITPLPSTVTIQVSPSVTMSTIANQTVCEGSILSIPAFSTTAAYTPTPTFEWQNSNPTINLSLSGIGNVPPFIAHNGSGLVMGATVQVRGVIVNGAASCAGAWESFTIEVDPKPTFNTIAPAALCEGANVTLTQVSHTANVNPPTAIVTFYSDLACTMPIMGAVSPAVTTIYYARAATAAGCTSTVEPVTVTVKPLPQLSSPTAVSICGGTQFEYVATSHILNGVSYSWARPVAAGISNPAASGMGATIREVLSKSDPTTPSAQAIYNITVTADGCSTTTPVTVTVNATAFINPIPTDLIQCSGDLFTFDFTGKKFPTNAVLWWDRLYVNGIEEPETYGVDVNINEVLTNSGTGQVVVRYALRSSTSAGCQTDQELRVTVAPTPMLSSNLYPNAICSGTMFNYTARSRTPNTAFSWRRMGNANITGTAAAGVWQNGNIIGDLLTNTTTIQQTVTYEVRMRYGLNATDTCEHIEVIELIVNPTPALSSSLANDTICSGEYFSYTLTSGTPSVNYVWNRPRVTGISQQMGFGTTPYITEMLTNTTSGQIFVTYNFTVEANGCSAFGFTKQVLVNPVPQISITNAPPVALSVGGTTIVNAISTTPVTGWNWTSSNPAIVSIIADSTTANAVIQANNIGTATLTVTAANALGGCEGVATILVNVGAAPLATLSLASSGVREICNDGISMLKVDIVNGTAPFQIVVENDVDSHLDTIIAYGSATEFEIHPPHNSGTTQMEVNYSLKTVKYGVGYGILVDRMGIVPIRVNPTVTVNNDMSDLIACEGELVAGRIFTSVTDPRVSYVWNNDNPNIGLAVSGVGSLPSFIAQNPFGLTTTATITITPSYRGTISCAGRDSSYTITINPKPEFNVIPPTAICVGDSYSFSGSDLQSATPAGSLIGFYEDYLCSTPITAPVSPLYTTTYFVRLQTPAPAGCYSEVKEITVTVKPRPQMTSVSTETVCSNDRLEYVITTDMGSGVLYTWTRAAITGINGGNSTSGNNSTIREQLINSTSTPIDVIYSITMSSQGCPTTDTLRVTVNPKPLLTIPTIPAICSGTTFMFTPTSTVPGVNYYWERVDATGILEAPTSGTDTISEILTNTTANSIQVSYLITVEKDGCSTTQQIRVTVKPLPVLSSSLAGVSICAGSSFIYNATSATRNSTFSWTRAAVAGNVATSGTTGTINEMLINNTTSDITAVYKITTTYETCATTDSILVTVHPTVNISSTLTPGDVCSEDYFIYTISSNVSNSNFTWRRQANANIQQPITNGSSEEIYEQLTIRNSTTAVAVNYIVRAEANGCMSTQQMVTVIVNPKPTVQIISPTPLDMAVTNVDTARAVTNGTVVGWISSNVNVATITQHPSDPTKAIVRAIGQGIAQMTLSVINPITGCTNEVDFIVNVEAAHTAVLTLAANGSSEICSGSATMLEVTINGGRAPFMVVYSNGITTDTIFNVGASVHRFMVQPSDNTGNIQQVTTYSLISVVESGPQDIVVIPSSVDITVNPVPSITTTWASPYTYCEGTVVNTLPSFTSDALPANRITYQWQNNNPAIGLGMSGTTSSIANFIAANGQGVSISAEITVTPYYRGFLITCQGIDTSFIIIVEPKPEFMVVNPAPICEGDSYTFTLADIASATPVGSVPTFYSDRACTTPVTTVTPLQTTPYFVRIVSMEGCISSTQEITVIVNPLPRLSSSHNETICSGEQFNYTATSPQTGVSYLWTRGAVPGLVRPATGGSGALIRETPENLLGTPIELHYIITMTAAGCVNQDSVILIVNPKPVLNNIPLAADLIICSGETFDYNAPTSNVAGATIYWEREDLVNIAEPGNSGYGLISESLTNLTSYPATVPYHFLLSEAGCEHTQTVRVIVNPEPVLSSTLDAGSLCSGSTFNYTARTSVHNATFSWERVADASIIPAPGTATATASISEVLTNTSANPVIVYYNITTTANGCIKTETVSVTINPLPHLSSTLTPADICSGSAFVYMLESATQGATYSWMRFHNVSINEAPSYGTAPVISEVLHNNTDSSTTVLYRVITEANGCRNAGDTVRVVVNALPQITITTPTPLNMAVNNTQVVEAVFASGTTAVWSSSNENVATVTVDATDQSKALVEAKMEGLAYVTLTVTDTLTGCSSSSTFAVNVSAENVAQLTIAPTYLPQVCSDGSTMLEVSMSGGHTPFRIYYTDGTNNYVDTSYFGTYHFMVTPPSNTTNAVTTTTYTLTQVIDHYNQTLTIIGDQVVIESNPVATVINTALLTNSYCEGDLIHVDAFTTDVVPAGRVQYYWDNNSTVIGLPLSGTGRLPVFVAQNGLGYTTEAEVTIVPVYSDLISCAGTPGVITLTINPKPDFIVVHPEPICVGENFSFTVHYLDIIQGITPNIVDIRFYKERDCLTPQIIVSPTETTTYYVRVTSNNGCVSEVKEVVITVNPVPTVDTIGDRMVCNHEGIYVPINGPTPNSVYYWSKSGIINPNITGLVNEGSTDIYAPDLGNNTTDIQEQEITVIPQYTGGLVTCTGGARTFVISVNPTPVLSSASTIADICNGGTIFYLPTTATAGATIMWEREYNEGILEDPSTGTGAINETLTNLTQTIVLVRYKMTLSINGCSQEQYVTTHVYPTPLLSSTHDGGSICSGATFTYTGTSTVNNTTFTWRRLANASIVEPVSAGTTPMISETLTNNSSIAVEVTYEITLTANGCSHIDYITVMVGAQLGITGTFTPSDICSGSYFNYTITSDAAVYFMWIRAFNANIEPTSNIGVGSEIHERLYNTTTIPQVVSYQIISTTAEGCSLTEEITFSVNPLPAITVSESPVVMAVGSTRTITVSSPELGNGSIVIANPTIATATYDGAGNITIAAGSTVGYTEMTYSTFNTLSGCGEEIVIPIIVTAGAQGTLSASGATTLCSAATTTLEITNIVNGTAPWTVAINYEGSTDADLVFTVNDIMDLPKTVTITVPSNTGLTHRTLNYYITQITDGEGSVRNSHIGRVPITILPIPTVNPIADQEICNNGRTATVHFSGAATKYRWSADENIGIEIFGEGQFIPSSMVSHSQSSPVDINIEVTPIYSLNGVNCEGMPQNFTITVNPLPIVELLYNVTVCNDSIVRIPFNGVAATKFICTTITNIGMATTEVVNAGDYLEFTGINNTPLPITATVNVQPVFESTSGLECGGFMQSFTITVNPSALLTSPRMNDTICSGDWFNYESTSSTDNVYFSWRRLDNAGLNPATSSQGYYIHDRLYNTTYAPVTASYEITLSYAGCPQYDTIKVVVNPIPELSSAGTIAPICNGAIVSYLPTTNYIGATITWEREANSLIAEEPTTGTGAISETLTNIGQTTVTVRYKMTLNEYGCSQVQYVTVKVYPTPLLSSTHDGGTICSGATFTYTATTAVAGTSYSWVRVANAAIAESVTGGNTALISEVLTNTGSVPVIVEYLFTLTANGCAHTETITVVVGAKLGLNSTLTPSDICSGDYFSYTITSAAAVSFSWTREFNANVQPTSHAGTGASINELLTNNSTTPALVRYFITSTTPTGCSLTEEVTFHVNPLPVITVSESAVVIASGATRNITVTEPTPANGTITTANSAIATATYNGAGVITIVGGTTVGTTELTYTTFNTTTLCENSIVIPVTVTPAPLATLIAAGATTVCSGVTTQLQITDIEYGKSPWTVELNYEGSTDPAWVVTVNDIMDLPKMVTITVPANTTLTHNILTYKITQVTDAEGSVRTTHIGLIPITILPVPIVEAIADQEVCNMGSSATVHFNGAATSYHWTVDQNVGLVMIGEGTYLPSAVVSHTQSTAVIANVTVTPVYSLNGVTCTGIAGTFSITVNPMATADLVTNVTLCSDEVVSVPLTGTAATKFICTTTTSIGMPTIVVVNAGNNLTFTAVNNTSLPVTATISVVPVYVSLSGLECSGEAINFTVTVYPVAILTSAIDNGVICSGEWFDYTATSVVSNVIYQWRRIEHAGLNPATSSQGNVIHERLFNSTNAAITALYEFTLTYNGCNHLDTIFVVVKPSPAIVLDSATYNVCPTESSIDITFTTTPAGIPIRYIVIYDDDARRAGFENILTYQTVTTSGVFTLPLPTGLKAGKYLGTIIIESDGCSIASSYQFTINVWQQTEIVQQADMSIVMCEDFGALRLEVAAIGEQLTYQWYHNGTVIVGATSSVYEVLRPNASDYGNYYVVVSGLCGTATGNTTTVTSNPAIIYQMSNDVIYVSRIDTIGQNLQYAYFQWYVQNAAGEFIPIFRNADHQYYQEVNGIDGTYMVEVFYVNGISFRSCPYTFTATPEAKKQKIYPNPLLTDETLHIQLDESTNVNDLSKMRLEIVRSNGQVLSTIVPNSLLVDVQTDLPAGFYLLKVIYADGSVQIHKLVVINY